MAGMLLVSGQIWVVDLMAAAILSLSGLYVGLMTNSDTPAETYQIGAGITELGPSASGYSRQLSGSWSNLPGTDPILSGSPVIFNVSGIWSDVNGYFVSTTASGSDALWAEPFSPDKQGLKLHGDRVVVTPKYEQKYDGEE